MTKLHASIAHLPLPPRMATLPLTETGFPVLFFADYVDGKPDLRIMDRRKLVRCIKEKRCWLCGQPLGRNMAFVLGPMCTITRTSSEPPSHYDCAAYATRACPFLTRPHMHRREAGLPEETQMAGIGVKRNPGVIALWVTRSYRTWSPPEGGILITVGNPFNVEWYAEGRPAFRAEVEASIESGLPLLYEQCDKDKDPAAAREDLEKYIDEAKELLPATVEVG